MQLKMVMRSQKSSQCGMPLLHYVLFVEETISILVFFLLETNVYHVLLNLLDCSCALQDKKNVHRNWTKQLCFQKEEE